MRSSHRIKTLCTASTLALFVAAAPALADDGSLGFEKYQPASQDMTKPGEFKKQGPYKIAFALPGLFSTWLVQQAEEAKQEASLHPEIARLVVISSDNAERQASDLEDQITKGVDAIVISPVSANAVNAQIEKAVAKGIPVVTFSTNASTDKVTTAVLSGGERVGEIMGDYLKKQLGGKGSVWAFRGIAGNSEDTERFDGLTKAIKGTDLKVTSQVYAEWNYAKGKENCENLVLSGQPVDGVWASGGEMSRGCIEVFQEVGKELVPMTGEGNNGFLRAAKDSGLKFVATTYPPTMGPAGVRAALALLKGESLHRSYWANIIQITDQNIDQYYRPELNDSYWVDSTLPEAKLQQLYKKN